MQTQVVASEKAPPPSFPENLPASWRQILAKEKDQAYFRQLTEFLKSEFQKNRQIFPPRHQMLRAFQLVDYDSVKVVILGQDPYHGPGQAIGLSFAVPNTLFPKPPSLMNIFKELQEDVGFTWNQKDSELTGWAEQGVLLLNTILSVRSGEPLSHADKGWEQFTDRAIEALNARTEPIIFLLWGANAQKKAELIRGEQHQILKAPHPSPLSAHRGFLGCRHFSKVNASLKARGISEIDWTKINAL